MSRMVSFRDGWRLFKEGLDRKLIWEYWLAVKSHGWEIFWGAGVIGIICTTVTLYYAPSRWVLGWTVAWVLLVAGYYVWRADHVRLERKIEVRVRKHSWPIETGGEGIQYYFEIVNKSEASTIYRVHAQLREIIPDNRDWLPVTLHQQHDNFGHDGKYAEYFDLNPLMPKNIDLFSTAINAVSFQVSHTVRNAPLIVSFSEKHRLDVTISGQDVPPRSVSFEVWKDKEGIPRCEIAQNTGSDASSHIS